MHAVVDPIDDLATPSASSGVPKVSVSIAAQGPVEPMKPSPALGAEAAMVRDASGDQRVGELEQDRAPPAGEQHHLPVQLPGHAVHSVGWGTFPVKRGLPHVTLDPRGHSLPGSLISTWEAW